MVSRAALGAMCLNEAVYLAKQEDDSFILHITYAFYYFSIYEATRNVLMEQPHVVSVAMPGSLS